MVNVIVMGHSDGEIEESDPTVLASVKDGVSWNEITGKPAGFADGVDNVGSVASVDPFVVKIGGAVSPATTTCGGSYPRTLYPRSLEIENGKWVMKYADRFLNDDCDHGYA